MPSFLLVEYGTVCVVAFWVGGVTCLFLDCLIVLGFHDLLDWSLKTWIPHHNPVSGFDVLLVSLDLRCHVDREVPLRLSLGLVAGTTNSDAQDTYKWIRFSWVPHYRNRCCWLRRIVRSCSNLTQSAECLCLLSSFSPLGLSECNHHSRCEWKFWEHQSTQNWTRLDPAISLVYFL